MGCTYGQLCKNARYLQKIKAVGRRISSAFCHAAFGKFSKGIVDTALAERLKCAFLNVTVYLITFVCLKMGFAIYNRKNH
jgi:hypothetical protein